MYSVFNNAEESLQDGSHLLLTQHPVAATYTFIIPSPLCAFTQIAYNIAPICPVHQLHCMNLIRLQNLASFAGPAQLNIIDAARSALECTKLCHRATLALIRTFGWSRGSTLSDASATMKTMSSLISICELRALRELSEFILMLLETLLSPQPT